MTLVGLNPPLRVDPLLTDPFLNEFLFRLVKSALRGISSSTELPSSECCCRFFSLRFFLCSLYALEYPSIFGRGQKSDVMLGPAPPPPPSDLTDLLKFSAGAVLAEFPRP